MPNPSIERPSDLVADGAPCRNVEIKARATAWAEQLRWAEALADARQELLQRDTFFASRDGLLKLRTFADGRGELIHYHRPVARGPRTSHYRRLPIACPRELEEVLGAACGLRGIVEKNRIVLHCGQTRIHFDEVNGLGRFIELEVVLRADQDEPAGRIVAEQLMADLGIARQDLIDVPYLELLERQNESA